MNNISLKQQLAEQTQKIVRRNFLANGIALSAYPILTKWTKPVISSVVLPAHATTSLEDMEEPPTTPSVSEIFATTINSEDTDTVGNGSDILFYVSVDDGTFTIQVYGFNPNTDLGQGIYRATINEIGQVTTGTWANCENDGTENEFPFSTSFQIISYTAGDNVVIQLENAVSYTIPLDNSAEPPACPIL